MRENRSSREIGVGNFPSNQMSNLICSKAREKPTTEDAHQSKLYHSLALPFKLPLRKKRARNSLVTRPSPLVTHSKILVGGCGRLEFGGIQKNCGKSRKVKKKIAD